MEFFDIFGFNYRFTKRNGKRYISFMFWMAGPKNPRLTSTSNKQKETLKILLDAMKKKGHDSYKIGDNF